MPDIQLPIVLEPLHAESAMGFVLRCAHANGTNLHGLRRAIGMPDVGLFTGMHIRSLAWLLQCSESWLSNGLGSVHKEDGVSTMYCWGHKFFATNHVRRLWPQICPECVHQEGHCHRVWDLSMSTICTKHKRWLIDECQHCHSRLRWDRPSLDICNCGHGFEPDTRPININKTLKSFALLLEAMVSEDLTSRLSDITPLPPFFRNMTVSGVVMLVEILGRLEFNHQIVHMSRRTKSLRTQEWDSLVNRALLRLHELEDSKMKSPILIDAVALKRLINRSTNQTELQVAWLLASRMPSSEMTLVRYAPFQHSLFS